MTAPPNATHAPAIHVLQYIRQRTRTSCADQFEYCAEIAGYETEDHSADDEGGGEDVMEMHVEWFAGEPVVEHDFTTDKSFEGEGGEHVEAETETGEVDERVCCGEVVEDVAEGFGTEG
ncbi:hypothetical protein BOTNAR_0201g00160 [Botryotinia narcissicola]|uniref:Uncharacterized protein n=1 Tax=Botryotinia narcissicola TaxID=278944 RepID=A0A4Z1IEF6_9HELO|nr:hypothetical protein BOTNAR_0201g00160 [Botryotinia narcissicola]